MTDVTFSLDDVLIEQEQLFDSIKRTIAVLSQPGTLSTTKATTILEHLQFLWPQGLEANVRLERMASGEDRRRYDYFKMNEFAEMEDRYLETVGETKAFLFGRSPGAPAPGLIPGIPIQSGPAPSVSTRHQTQLPRIPLPRFSGTYKDWATFHDYFTSLFVNDQSFDNLHRMHYLKSCLDGEAASLLKNINITAANFPIAWKLLSDRYSNKRSLLNVHLTNLFTLLPVAHESPAELRRLLDSSSESIEALRNLNRPVDEWDDLLVFMIVRRLYKTTRKAWELQFDIQEKCSRFRDVEAFLNTRIRALEAAQPDKPKTNVVARTSKASNVQSHHAETSPSRCPVCVENHYIYKCKKSKPIQQRLEIVERHKLCENCLAPHSVKSCGSRRTCFHCNKRHHSLLHPLSDDAAIEGEASTARKPVANAGSTEKPVDCTLVQTHLSSSFQPSHVVLATAWVLVTSSSQRVVKVRALLDQGSTHTFVSKTLVDLLNTRTYPVMAGISGIGGNASTRVDRIVPITVASTSGKGMCLSTDALIMDSLTNYIPRFRNPLSCWDYLRGLPLADERPTDATPIQLVIGADLYSYALRTGLRRGGPGQPVAQNTIFGWVLSGDTTLPSFSPTSAVHAHHIQAHSDLDLALRRF